MLLSKKFEIVHQKHRNKTITDNHHGQDKLLDIILSVSQIQSCTVPEFVNIHPKDNQLFDCTTS